MGTLFCHTNQQQQQQNYPRLQPHRRPPTNLFATDTAKKTGSNNPSANNNKNTLGLRKITQQRMQPKLLQSGDSRDHLYVLWMSIYICVYCHHFSFSVQLTIGIMFFLVMIYLCLYCQEIVTRKMLISYSFFLLKEKNCDLFGLTDVFVGIFVGQWSCSIWDTVFRLWLLNSF